MWIPTWLWKSGPVLNLKGYWEFACCLGEGCVPQDVLWDVLWEYEVPGQLLCAIRALYIQNESYVSILRKKLSTFPASTGLSQSCTLSFLWWPQKWIATFCSGFIRPQPPAQMQVKEFQYLGVLFMSVRCNTGNAPHSCGEEPKVSVNLPIQTLPMVMSFG